MTEKQLLKAFAEIKFHVSGQEDNHYCVAAFGDDDTLTGLAGLLVFDEFHEFDKLDNVGNVSLSDNGSPFESVEDVIKTLVDVFSSAIEDGFVTEEAIRSQVLVWPDGVGRTALRA